MTEPLDKAAHPGAVKGMGEREENWKVVALFVALKARAWPATQCMQHNTEPTGVEIIDRSSSIRPCWDGVLQGLQLGDDPGLSVLAG